MARSSSQTLAARMAWRALLRARESLAEARFLTFLRCSRSALEGSGADGAGSAYPSSVCSHASSAAEYCACGGSIFSSTAFRIAFYRVFWRDFFGGVF